MCMSQECCFDMAQRIPLHTHKCLKGQMFLKVFSESVFHYTELE